MKRCRYCGAENESEATYCRDCGTQFMPVVAPAGSESPVADVVTTELQAAAPEEAATIAWTARDAWKCLGMLVVFAVVLDFIWGAIGVQFPIIAICLRTGFGHFGISIVSSAVYLLTMLYFARAESIRAALKPLGLSFASASSYVWFGVVVALIIRGISHFVIVSRWSKGATTISLWGFAHSVGWERLFYLAPALIAPFAEELVERGFLYRAFRGSYSATVSILLILGLTALTHWNQVHRSWAAAVSISTLTVLLCLLRERTGNLWDCIICHFVFNASGALGVLRVH